MNAKIPFFSDHRQKIAKKIDLYRFCSKGYHSPDEESYYCSRCSEQLNDLPVWKVQLLHFRGEDITCEIAEINAESALIEVLSQHIQYLIKDKEYFVENIETEELYQVTVDELLFEEIFDVYEFKSNSTKNSAADHMVAIGVRNFIILMVFLCAVNFIMSDNFGLFKGALLVLGFAVFVTSMLYEGFVLSEKAKEEKESIEE